jgi:hypothetical protein
MKPPWKYLAQLMSRRRPPEAQDQTNERAGDRRPVEIEVQPAPAIVLASPETAADPVHDDVSQSNDLAETESEPRKAAPVSLPPDVEEQDVGAIDAQHQSGSDVRALAAPARWRIPQGWTGRAAIKLDQDAILNGTLGVGPSRRTLAQGRQANVDESAEQKVVFQPLQ